MDSKTKPVMHDIKVFQINKDRDIEHMSGTKLYAKYMKDDPRYNESIYDEVFSAKMTNGSVKQLDEYFSQPNNHPLYRGTPLSTSDVLVIDNQAYYKNPNALIGINFNEDLAFKDADLLDIVYVEPHLPPYKAEVKNELSYLQKAVKGDIEIVDRFSDRALIICNEEGKLIGMEGNRRIDSDCIIAGPMIICGDDGEDLSSLSNHQIENYLERFKEPEDISLEEIRNDMTMRIYSGNSLEGMNLYGGYSLI